MLYLKYDKLYILRSIVGMIKVGVVNIDTSHPLEFAKEFQKDDRARYTAVFNDGFRNDDEINNFVQKFCLDKICNSIEELAECVDVGFIQGCNWDKHLDYVMPFAERNKPEVPAEPVIDVEAKPEISYEDFDKLQFRVGKIIACEEVKKSKKLLCSQVQIGSEVKQIVSGIKQHYTAEEMVGKKVMVLVNLKPATLAGVMSEGMLLCAEDADGNLALMTPEKDMPAGAEIA